MKKRKFLAIPFTIIPGITLAVTTSAIVLSMPKSEDMVDISKTYTPTITKAESGTALTEEVAQEMYFEEIASNPNILKEDVYKYESEVFETRIYDIEHPNDDTKEFEVSDKEAKILISNVSINKVTSGSKTFYTVSADVKYIFNYTATATDSSKKIVSKVSNNISLRNIPTELYGEQLYVPSTDSFVTHWQVSNNFINSELLESVQDWSYSFDRKDTQTITTYDAQGEPIITTKNNDGSGTYNTTEQIEELIASDPNIADYYGSILNFDSYHMSDVQIDNPLYKTFNLDLENGKLPCSVSKFGSQSDHTYSWEISPSKFIKMDDEGTEWLAQISYLDYAREENYGFKFYINSIPADNKESFDHWIETASKVKKLKEPKKLTSELVTDKSKNTQTMDFVYTWTDSSSQQHPINVLNSEFGVYPTFSMEKHACVKAGKQLFYSQITSGKFTVQNLTQLLLAQGYYYNKNSFNYANITDLDTNWTFDLQILPRGSTIAMAGYIDNDYSAYCIKLAEPLIAHITVQDF